jgi:hypothetical protein
MKYDFKKFKNAVQVQMQSMFASEGVLLQADIDNDKIWEIYLDSFPEGTNNIFRNRREYDCNCCKQFIRGVGGLLVVNDGVVSSIWDIQMASEDAYPYVNVAQQLSKYVKSLPIRNVFFSPAVYVGVEKNRQILEDADSTVITWDHFCAELPRSVVAATTDLGNFLSEARSAKDVLKRGLEEITVESLRIVLELISQNVLYRGEEHFNLVKMFAFLKAKYLDLSNDKEKEIFCWVEVVKNGVVARFRNSVIGTLLVDLSEGRDLENAVKSYAAKVAPANYKRPKALITKTMIDSAQKEIEQLGLGASLERRHATEQDISVNDVIYVNKNIPITETNDVFDVMKQNIPVGAKTLNRVDSIPIVQFLEKVVPVATSIEILLENRHVNNLINIVAPVHKNAPSMFKWGNAFSWSYNGELADSIKERVKKAGGCIDAALRCSLSWFNTDDLDIHVREPDGNIICYRSKRSIKSGAKLDVDMNVDNLCRDAVENVVWPNENTMLEGDYEVFVHNFTKRETIDVGFSVEVECQGTQYNFNYPKSVADKATISVLKFYFSKQEGIKILKSIPEENVSKVLWGLKTQQYHKVRMLLNSPNHWGGNAIGNKHWCFILKDAYNPDGVRGFYNEFLKEGLIKQHRKVLEVLGSIKKVPVSDDQLCGLGFSSTKKDHFFAKVQGTFSRVVKVVIT